MNIIDIILLLLFVMFFIVGFKRGIIKEAASIIGIVVMFIIAFLLKGYVGNLLCTFLPFFNFTGSLEGLVAINILIYQLIGFLVVYGLLYSIYAIILTASKILQKLVDITLVLLLPSKLLGGLFSFLKCYIIVFVIILVCMIPFKDNTLFNESEFVPFILEKTPILSNASSNITSSIDEIYTLGDKLSKKELTTNEANLQTIDVMLKYKVVDKKTIVKLQALHKLDEINGLNKILDKYE